MGERSEGHDKVISKLVSDLVTDKDKQLDEKRMKQLKRFCKNSDESLTLVHEQLFKQMNKNNADIRLLCSEVFDELFSRSHLFRTLTIERFEELTILSTGIDSLKSLPLPKESAKQLQSKSIQMFKKWIDNYKEGYPQLRVIYEALKRKVNFDRNTLVNDVDEMRREAEREREATLWRGRVLQVEKEVIENQDALDRCMQESRACIDLWLEGERPGLEDARTISVCDQYNILYRKLIPLCKTWSVTLTKAGRHTQHQLLRKCVDLKRSLDDLFEEIVKLGIDFDKFNSARIVDDKPKKKDFETDLFSDPTTLAANVKKYNTDFPSKSADFPSKSDFLSDIKDDAGPSTSKVKDNMSMEKVKDDVKSEDKCEMKKKEEIVEKGERVKRKLDNVPVVKMSELVSGYVVERNLDLDTVWLNGELASTTSTSTSPIKRIITLSEKFEPVTRSCRHPLQNGGLCPRKDRYKCPFHGLIVERDDQGAPVTSTSSPGDSSEIPESEVESPTASSSSISPAAPSSAAPSSASSSSSSSPWKKNKPRGSRKLVSQAKEKDTSRLRLHKKVLNKSAVKRVARRLDAQDMKRAKSLFSEQFNYSM